MEEMEIRAPAESGIEALARFTCEVADAQGQSLLVDFADAKFTSPAWLAIVGGALRAARHRYPGVRRRAANHRQLHYAAHLGFFRYFGLSYGLAPAAAAGSDTYVPLTEHSTEDVRKHARRLRLPAGQLVHEEAARLAIVLTQERQGALHDTVTYSIREIVRNVIEHSRAPSYTVAAQWWPTLSQVELVVTDEGCGLAASLRENPHLAIADDEAALRQAILPGVSSKAWREGKRRDDWANSGYGLFMTQGLSASGGSFGILSGARGILVAKGETKVFPARWPGVAVVLRLETREMAALRRRLALLRTEGALLERDIAGAARHGASGASQTVRPGGRKPERSDG